MTLNSQHGYLYGTTSNGGGLAGDGPVFVINLALGTTTLLHQFVGSDGANPFGQLHIDGQGNIFGTTSAGPDGFGTVFELQADGQPYQYEGQLLNMVTLHAFGGVSTDGVTR